MTKVIKIPTTLREFLRSKDTTDNTVIVSYTVKDKTYANLFTMKTPITDEEKISKGIYGALVSFLKSI